MDAHYLNGSVEEEVIRLQSILVTRSSHSERYEVTSQ